MSLKVCHDLLLGGLQHGHTMCILSARFSEFNLHLKRAMASCPLIGHKEVRTIRPLVYAQQSVLEMTQPLFLDIGSLRNRIHPYKAQTRLKKFMSGKSGEKDSYFFKAALRLGSSL